MTPRLKCPPGVAARHAQGVRVNTSTPCRSGVRQPPPAETPTVHDRPRGGTEEPVTRSLGVQSVSDRSSSPTRTGQLGNSLATARTVRVPLSVGYFRYGKSLAVPRRSESPELEPGTSRGVPRINKWSREGGLSRCVGDPSDRSESQSAAEGQPPGARAGRWTDPPRSSSAVP